MRKKRLAAFCHSSAYVFSSVRSVVRILEILDRCYAILNSTIDSP